MMRIYRDPCITDSITTKHQFPIKDYKEAARLLKDVESRRVAIDIIEVEDYSIKISISTVFLVVDTSLDGEKPVLFETMIYDGDSYFPVQKFIIWEEANKGHIKTVGLVKNKIWLNRILDMAAINTSNKRVAKAVVEGIRNNLHLN